MAAGSGPGCGLSWGRLSELALNQEKSEDLLAAIIKEAVDD
jgi:hypothetical protein